MNKLLLILSLFIFTAKLQSQEQSLIDSLMAQLKQLEAEKMELRNNSSSAHDTAHVNLLNKLSDAYYRNQPDMALSYAEKALALANEVEYKKGISASIINIGRAHESRGDYSKALDQYNKAFISYYELGDKDGIANSYKCIGNIYAAQANFTEAIKNYLASLKIVEELGNKLGIANVTNNLGTVYNQQKNYPEALRYFKSALKIYEEIHEKDGFASSYMNIGNIYGIQGNSVEALKYISSALKMFEELGNTEYMAGAYVNIGSIQSGQKNYEEALKNFEKAKELFEVLGNKWGIAISCNNIGGILTNQKKYLEATDYLNKSLHLSREMGALGLRAANYKTLATVDSCLGNHKGEVLHFKAYVAIRDSIKNIESSKKILQMQNQYDFEKQEMISKAQKEKDEKAHEHKELMEYLGIFCFILFLFSLLLLFTRLNVSGKTFDTIGFIGVVLFFQFLESVIHPKLYPFIHGSPLLFILFNVILASAIKPLHHMIEHRLIAFSAKRKEKIDQKKIVLVEEITSEGQENKDSV